MIAHEIDENSQSKPQLEHRCDHEATSAEKMVKLKDVRKLTTLGETHHIFFCVIFAAQIPLNLHGKILPSSSFHEVFGGGHWILSILNLNHFFG